VSLSFVAKAGGMRRLLYFQPFKFSSGVEFAANLRAFA
jgi:hypothetical protein